MIRKLMIAIAALSLLGCMPATTAGTPVSSGESTPAVSPETTPETSPQANPAPAAEQPQETIPPSSAVEPVPVTDSEERIDYSASKNWCYFGTDANAKADAFLVNATIYQAPVGNAALTDDLLSKQTKFINRLSGMVSDRCTIYAPHYREMTLDDFVSENEKDYADYAYRDVSDAFRYYIDHVHKAGTPMILFGFSQSGYMVKRIMEEYFSPDTDEAKALRDDLVSAYIIGFGTEKEWYDAHPNLHPAQGKDDIGVVISFDAETPEVTDSMVLKKGTEYVSINPINWKTDSTRANARENLGYVLVSGSGKIKNEIPGFCSAYLDDTERHALKVDDINYLEYSNQVAYLPVGSYHVYDIVFFYRNIQQNVNERIDAWLAAH